MPAEGFDFVWIESTEGFTLKRSFLLVGLPSCTGHSLVRMAQDLMDLSEDRSRLDFFFQKRQKVVERAEADVAEVAGQFAGEPNVWEAEDRPQLITLPFSSSLAVVGQAGESTDLKAPDGGAQPDQSRTQSFQRESAARSQLPSGRDGNAPDVCGLETGSRDGAGLVGEVREELFGGDESVEGVRRAPPGLPAICSGTVLQPHESLANDSVAPGLCSRLGVSAVDVWGRASGQVGLDGVDLAGVDVTEQEEILRRINEERRRQQAAIMPGLRKRKQTTLACFVGR